MSSTADMTRCRPSVLGGGFCGPPRGAVPGQLQLAVAVRGPHHRDLAPDAVRADGAVRHQAFDLPLAFQLHAELGEERAGGWPAGEFR
jgi:hypothetical protein